MQVRYRVSKKLLELKPKNKEPSFVSSVGRCSVIVEFHYNLERNLLD